MKINKMFVYGTLQRGYYNERFLPDYMISKIWDATLSGDLYMVKHASFPAVVNVNSGNTVYGELYEIKEEYIENAIESCDYLEGHPILYKRTLVDVKDAHGETHKAYAYIFCQLNKLGERIEDGWF